MPGVLCFTLISGSHVWEMDGVSQGAALVLRELALPQPSRGPRSRQHAPHCRSHHWAQQHKGEEGASHRFRLDRQNKTRRSKAEDVLSLHSLRKVRCVDVKPMRVKQTCDTDGLVQQGLPARPIRILRCVHANHQRSPESS